MSRGSSGSQLGGVQAILVEEAWGTETHSWAVCMWLARQDDRKWRKGGNAMFIHVLLFFLLFSLSPELMGWYYLCSRQVCSPYHKQYVRTLGSFQEEMLYSMEFILVNGPLLSFFYFVDLTDTLASP